MVDNHSERVLVTGGGSGIGRATIERLQARGASVVAVDRGFPDGVPAGTATLVADVSDPAAMSRSVTEAVDTLGGLTGVVCAAGVAPRGTVETVSLDDWDTVLGVNLSGVFYVTREAIPHLRRNGGGSIVAVASQLGIVAGRDNAAYCASKAALIMLMKTIALDFGHEGIRANSVCPGPTETAMLRRFFDNPEGERERAAIVATQLHGRLIQPDEIAAAICFLLSSDSASIFGESLVVDGGYVIS